MDLLQHLVDVDAVRFLPPALLLLISLGNALLSFASFLSGLSGGLWWHPDVGSNRTDSGPALSDFLFILLGPICNMCTLSFGWVR